LTTWLLVIGCQIVHKLLKLANDRKIHFTLPDEAFGHNDNITVTGASVKSGMIYYVIYTISWFQS